MAEHRDLLLQEQLSGPAPIPCGLSFYLDCISSYWDYKARNFLHGL